MNQDQSQKNSTNSGHTEKNKIDRREMILDAAAEVFSTQGYSASIDQIADSMGVSKGHIYYYFKSKQDILFQIFKHAMDFFFENVTSQAEPGLPVDERLQAVLKAHVSTLCDNIHIMTVFMDLYRELAPENREQIIASRDRYERFIQGLLHEGMEKGYFEEDDVKILSYAILGSINWVYIWYNARGKLDKETVAEKMSSYLVRGLRKRIFATPETSGRSIDEVAVGDSASYSKTITENDIYLFAGITGDFNPIHLDEDYARKTRYHGRIAHGGITTSLVAPVLGTLLPGVGSVIQDMQCHFKAPVYPGDTITVTATVAARDKEKNRLQMHLKWENQEGRVVSEGDAVVIPPG